MRLKPGQILVPKDEQHCWPTYPSWDKYVLIPSGSIVLLVKTLPETMPVLKYGPCVVLFNDQLLEVYEVYFKELAQIT